jgi:hypothetical protein
MPPTSASRITSGSARTPRLGDPGGRRESSNAAPNGAAALRFHGISCRESGSTSPGWRQDGARRCFGLAKVANSWRSTGGKVAPEFRTIRR